MDLKEFDYDLPEKLIAQRPLKERAASRLMVVDRGRTGGGVADHSFFRELPRFLDLDDVVVVNRSRVVPARVLLRRESGGEVEVLYLRGHGALEFDAWVKPAARLKPGDRLLDFFDLEVFVERFEALCDVLRAMLVDLFSINKEMDRGQQL